MACRILVPWPEIEPRPPAVEAWNPTHWNDRKLLEINPKMKWVLCGWLGSITIAFKVVGVFVLCFGLLVFFLLLVFVSRLPSTRWTTDCTGPDGVAPITSQEVTLRPGLCWGDGVGSGRGWGGCLCSSAVSGTVLFCLFHGINKRKPAPGCLFWPIRPVWYLSANTKL